MGLRDSDRRTFDYFISYTAPRLAGAWDKVGGGFFKLLAEMLHHADSV